jgi:hypothetical protein
VWRTAPAPDEPLTLREIDRWQRDTITTVERAREDYLAADALAEYLKNKACRYHLGITYEQYLERERLHGCRR